MPKRLSLSEAEDQAGFDAEVVLPVPRAVVQARHEVIGLVNADREIVRDLGVQAADGGVGVFYEKIPLDVVTFPAYPAEIVTRFAAA